MWEQFKNDWKKSNLVEKFILSIFYLIGLILGFLFAIIWNTYGAVIIVGIGIILIDDSIPSEQLIGIAGSLVLLFKLVKFFLKEKE